MITHAELAALVAILQRVPVTAAEKLWLQALVDRLSSAIAERERAAMESVTES